MVNCDYEDSCQNNGNKCLRCSDHNLYKCKWKNKGQRKTAALISTNNTKQQSADNSWEDLEQQVADALNNIPTMVEARRSIASGALWFEKGDIVDTILHPECKERKGKELKSGEKSISIKREWLEKARKECKDTDKTMCLPFRFKGDDNIYCIFRNDDIVSLVTTMKAFIMDNECKDKEIQQLKKIINDLKGEQ